MRSVRFLVLLMVAAIGMTLFAPSSAEGARRRWTANGGKGRFSSGNGTRPTNNNAGWTSNNQGVFTPSAPYKGRWVPGNSNLNNPTSNTWTQRSGKPLP